MVWLDADNGAQPVSVTTHSIGAGKHEVAVHAAAPTPVPMEISFTVVSVADEGMAVSGCIDGTSCGKLVIKQGGKVFICIVSQMIDAHVLVIPEVGCQRIDGSVYSGSGTAGTIAHVAGYAHMTHQQCHSISFFVSIAVVVVI